MFMYVDLKLSVSSYFKYMSLFPNKKIFLNGQPALCSIFISYIKVINIEGKYYLTSVDRRTNLIKHFIFFIEHQDQDTQKGDKLKEQVNSKDDKGEEQNERSNTGSNQYF